MIAVSSSSEFYTIESRRAIDQVTDGPYHHKSAAFEILIFWVVITAKFEIYEL